MSDANFESAAQARNALVKGSPGGRPARPEEDVDALFVAAREGLDFYYEQTVLGEWLSYQEKVERTIGNLRPPKFTEYPWPRPASAPTSKLIESADGYKSAAANYFGVVTASARASRDVRKKFGPAVDSLLKDRDAAQVLMAAYTLWRAHERGSALVQPADLALLAVVVGVDLPMSTKPDDTVKTRQKRWGYTHKRALEYARQRAMVPPA